MKNTGGHTLPTRCDMCRTGSTSGARLVPYVINDQLIIQLHTDCVALYTTWHGADDITPLFPATPTCTES